MHTTANANTYTTLAYTQIRKFNRIFPLQNETIKHSNVGGSSDVQSLTPLSFAMRILPTTLWHNNGF